VIAQQTGENLEIRRNALLARKALGTEAEMLRIRRSSEHRKDRFRERRRIHNNPLGVGIRTPHKETAMQAFRRRGCPRNVDVHRQHHRRAGASKPPGPQRRDVGWIRAREENVGPRLRR
jgi:hypothetical protein